MKHSGFRVWGKSIIRRGVPLVILIMTIGCRTDLQPSQPNTKGSLQQASNTELPDSLKPYSSTVTNLRDKGKGITRSTLAKSPRPAYDTIKNRQQPVRAIYVTSHVARGKRMSQLIDLMDQTELNAMVIDVNHAFSLIRNKDGSSSVRRNAAASQLTDLGRKLKNHGVYMIARVVTFKNPGLANAKPEWSIQARGGGVWRDHGGEAWIDPYRTAAWEYPIQIAEHAADMGFDEVQFDYVRFPENGARVDREVHYFNSQSLSKNQVIKRFLNQASERVHKRGSLVSADVFGMVASPGPDMGIGQSWTSVAGEVDVISPMIYPSHYSQGTWGIHNPDLMPGKVVRQAMQDAVKKNLVLESKGQKAARIRPWLQGFTAGWVHPHQRYGSRQIREQVAAAKQAGVGDYMLWNAASRYETLK